MGNMTSFNIGGPWHADIRGAMQSSPADVEVDENSKRIRVNMQNQSDFIIEGAREVGDPKMKNSKITSTYYDIEGVKIHVNGKGEVMVDIYSRYTKSVWFF
jgi:hypothetical protein